MGGIGELRQVAGGLDISARAFRQEKPVLGAGRGRGGDRVGAAEGEQGIGDAVAVEIAEPELFRPCLPDAVEERVRGDVDELAGAVVEDGEGGLAVRVSPPSLARKAMTSLSPSASMSKLQLSSQLS